jgi:hypothetical protein
MNTKGGYIEYKCRRCGKIDACVHVPDMKLCVILLTVEVPLPEQWGGLRPTMLSVHGCDDGGLGVSDLIGGVSDK